LHFDIVITGGGMAGLSLAWRLSRSPLRDKKILLIDREPKDRNDRTWGFWEAGEGPFESVLSRQWSSVWFHGSGGFSAKLGLGPYRYKLLRGIDFYRFVRAELAACPSVEYCCSPILSITSSASVATVTTEKGVFTADWCFDSTYLLQAVRGGDISSHSQNLLQHFKGWVIRTKEPAFDTETPVMMDFRIPQLGECRFVYVLPYSATEALVEFTLFTEALLEESAYRQGLMDYIRNFTGIREFEIVEEEFGIIPMTDEKTYEQPSPRVIRIGTAGGYTRASTGYTFTRTQKRLQQLVANLSRNWEKPPVEGLPAPIPLRFRFYDQVFLNVFLQKRYAAAPVFTDLYRKNPAERIFRFLDEETGFPEDLRVLYSVAIWPFTVAAGAVLLRNISEKFKR
jgi:lycopene beta-cyclase